MLLYFSYLTESNYQVYLLESEVRNSDDNLFGSTAFDIKCILIHGTYLSKLLLIMLHGTFHCCQFTLVIKCNIFQVQHFLLVLCSLDNLVSSIFMH